MRDTLGIVPNHIRANIEREEMIDRCRKAAPALDRALRDYDDRLSLVYVTENVDPRMAYYGAKPGRFHVRRQNDPPAADSYMPIETPEGGFREPDSGVLNELRDRDTWNGGGKFPKIRTGYRNGLPYGYEDDGGAQERKEALQSEQRQDEMKADLAAGRRVAGDGGLTKRKWGKK